MSKIRFTGKLEQLQALISALEEYSGYEITHISKPYPQTRYNQKSKDVAIYVEVKDLEE